MSFNDIRLIVEILTLIALVIYVWKTWAMASATRESVKVSEEVLKEMKENRDQETRPYVKDYHIFMLNRKEYMNS